MTRRLLVALALVACAGCSLSPSADVIKALASDPATVSISVNSIYGTVRWCRTNITAGDVTCNDTGIQVKSQPAGVSVPILVTPQISVGAPTTK
jgi:hypothetical protein